jgi:hypothetical protein
MKKFVLSWTLNIGVVESLRKASVRPSVKITGVLIFLTFDSREFRQKLSKSFSFSLERHLREEVPALDNINFTPCVGTAF